MEKTLSLVTCSQFWTLRADGEKGLGITVSQIVPYTIAV